MSSLWIILTACAVSGTGAVLGTLMTVRRMTMIADAIAHAVLPGIVAGFWLQGDLNSPLLIAGAGMSGILATLLIDGVRYWFGLRGDAGTGLIFTFLFSIGVLMISRFSDVDLDMDCVLFGEIAFVPLDTINILGFNIGARAFWISLLMLLISTATFEIFYRRWLAVSFDENFSKTTGIAYRRWHYFLMSLVSFFIVSSFSSVGLVLVMTFLAIPAATAYLFRKSLRSMVYTGFLFGIVNSVCGYYLARMTDTSIAGAMAVVSGLVFFAAILFQKVAFYQKTKTQ